MDNIITEYQPTDRKPWFAEQKKSGGLCHMNAFAIGVITSIVRDCSRTPDEKVLEIIGTLSDMNEVWDDESIPDGYLDTKKAPIAVEAPKETIQPQCIVNVTKVQSLLEPWYLEQILREKESP